MKRAFTGRRLLRFAGIVLFLALLVLYVGLPLVMAVVTVLFSGAGEGDAPPGFNTVSLTTSDGIELAGWYAPPERGAAIVLVHGGGEGRGSLRDYAVLLRDHGFGVLALNLRGFGDSGGQLNRLGWNGSRDIGAALAFLNAQPEVTAIGGLGLSLGGEVLLGAAAEYPALQAIVTDGATFRFAAEYESLPLNSPWYRSFTQHVFNFFVRLFSGDAPPKPTLLESIRQADTTQFLFIAAGAEEEEVAYNTLFQAETAGRSALWVIANAGHTGGYALNPAAYEARVIEFLVGALPG